MPHKSLEERQAYHRAYREKHRESLAAKEQAFKAANPEKVAAQKRADYEKHKDAYKARAKASRERRADEIKAHRSTPEYRAKINEARRAAYIPHPLPPPKTREEILADKRADYARNKDRYRKQGRAYYQANRHLWTGKWGTLPFWERRFRHNLSKACAKGAEIIDIDSIREFYRQVFSQPQATCDYCRGVFPITGIVVEHKHPYVLGGVHSVSNFAVSCSLCNLKKGELPYESWIAKNT